MYSHVTASTIMIQNSSVIPQIPSCYPFIDTPTPLPLLLATSDGFSITVVLSFGGCCINGLMKYVTLRLLLVINIKHLRFIQVFVNTVVCYFVFVGVPLYGCTTVCLLIHWLNEICNVSGFW